MRGPRGRCNCASSHSNGYIEDLENRLRFGSQNEFGLDEDGVS